MSYHCTSNNIMDFPSRGILCLVKDVAILLFGQTQS